MWSLLLAQQLWSLVPLLVQLLAQLLGLLVVCLQLSSLWVCRFQSEQ